VKELAPSTSACCQNNAKKRNAVLDDAVETAKHVKFRPLNARMFKLAGQEIGE
jgi:hypothetical protein